MPRGLAGRGRPASLSGRAGYVAGHVQSDSGGAARAILPAKRHPAASRRSQLAALVGARALLSCPKSRDEAPSHESGGVSGHITAAREA